MDFKATPSTENTLAAKAFTKHIHNTTGTRENTPITGEAAENILKTSSDKEKTILSTKSVPVTNGAKENGPNQTGKINITTVNIRVQKNLRKSKEIFLFRGGGESNSLFLSFFRCPISFFEGLHLKKG